MVLAVCACAGASIDEREVNVCRGAEHFGRRRHDGRGGHAGLQERR